MKRNVLILVAVVIAVAFVIYAGARLSRQPQAVAVAAARVSLSSAEGSSAPDFTLDRIDFESAAGAAEHAGTLSLASLRGHAVLLNFWATWCAPCKIEMPWFVDLYKQYHPQGLDIVGVAMDDSGRGAIADFAREMHVNYTILQGKEAVGDQYGGVQFLPETFIIDRQGKIVKALFGIHSESDFEEAIKRALGTSPASGKAVASSQ